MSIAKGTPWTEADKAALKRLHGEGKSAKTIGEVLGRTTPSVYAKMLGMGLSKNRGPSNPAAYMPGAKEVRKPHRSSTGGMVFYPKPGVLVHKSQ